mgnify:CR=1 FL=1
MAAERYREKEHAFITIGKDIKAGKIPSLVLLCGKEEYLIRSYTLPFFSTAVLILFFPLFFSPCSGAVISSRLSSGMSEILD